MSVPLETAAAEVEGFVAQSGWDQRPTLFALVRAAQFATDEPDAAARLGIDDTIGDALYPIEQEELPEGELDEVLAQIGWPDTVEGCALAQEIVILPPEVQEQLADADALDMATVAAHPDRREARLVVAVLRGGGSAAVLRLRARGEDDESELLTGPDLAPNLSAALLDTLA